MSNNDNIEGLRFSPEAKDIKFLFYHGLNDFNLFVEDAHDEYLYETLIDRLLEGYNYKINDIGYVTLNGGFFHKKNTGVDFNVCY